MQKTTPKHLVWLGFFILLVWSGDHLISAVLNILTEQSEFRYSRMYKGNARADILAIGNSRGLFFQEPVLHQLTGKQTLNLSYNGMPANLALTLLQDYYDRYPAPALLLLDISMCYQPNDALIAAFSLYTPQSKHIAHLLQKTQPHLYWGSQAFHLVRYNGEVFQRSMFYLNRSDAGWVPQGELSAKLAEQAIQQPVIPLYPDSGILNDLKQIVHLAQAHKTTVRLILNPYYPPYVSKLPHIEDFTNKITQQTGLPVHDYSRLLSDRTLFADYTHLNAAGSTQFLLRLQQDGLLKQDK